MRLYIFFILLSVNTFAQNENEVRGFPEDKLLHMTAGFVTSATTSSLLAHYNVKHSQWIGFGVGTIVGIGKELYDKYSGTGNPELLDATACIIGSGLGSFTVYFAINPRENKDKKKNKRKNKI